MGDIYDEIFNGEYEFVLPPTIKSREELTQYDIVLNGGLEGCLNEKNTALQSGAILRNDMAIKGNYAKAYTAKMGEKADRCYIDVICPDIKEYPRLEGLTSEQELGAYAIMGFNCNDICSRGLINSIDIQQYVNIIGKDVSSVPVIYSLVLIYGAKRCYVINVKDKHIKTTVSLEPLGPGQVSAFLVFATEDDAKSYIKLHNIKNAKVMETDSVPVLSALFFPHELMKDVPEYNEKHNKMEV